MDLLNFKLYSCSGHLYSINYSLIQNYSLKINTKHLTTVTSVKHVILYGNGSDSLIWLIRIRDPKIFENVKTTKPKNILKVIFFNYSYLRQNYTDWTNYLLKKNKKILSLGPIQPEPEQCSEELKTYFQHTKLYIEP